MFEVTSCNDCYVGTRYLECRHVVFGVTHHVMIAMWGPGVGSVACCVSETLCNVV